MIRGVVFTHVRLGLALCEAVESFLGPQGDLVGLSNEGLSSEDMSAALREAIEEAPDGAVVFTSVFGGSCWQAAERLRRENSRVRHITGVNLPMLLALVNKREQMELDALTETLASYGRKGIHP
ncbi:MAG: hypothetical protein R6W82_07560 [bacterium]